MCQSKGKADLEVDTRPEGYIRAGILLPPPPHGLNPCKANMFFHDGVLI